MKKIPVNLELMQFVEQQILPRYNRFDKAHNLAHVERVIRRALEIGQKLGVDMDMVYLCAAYHDLGLEGPRAIHHLTGGKILAADARLGRWFSGEQIRTMREAVEDHRASASHSPRNIYGKIIAEADRDLEPEVVFQRTVAFALEKYPGKSKEEHWERFVRHLQEKYSSSGYIRLWIPGSKNEEHLKEIRHFIESPGLLRAAFERCFKAASSAG